MKPKLIWEEISTPSLRFIINTIHQSNCASKKIDNIDLELPLLTFDDGSFSDYEVVFSLLWSQTGLERWFI